MSAVDAINFQLMLIAIRRADRFKERNKDGVVHQFVDDLGRFIKSGWVRRCRSARLVEEAVANGTGEVDFAGGARNNVRLHQPDP